MNTAFVITYYINYFHIAMRMEKPAPYWSDTTRVDCIVIADEMPLHIDSVGYDFATGQRYVNLGSLQYGGIEMLRRLHRSGFRVTDHGIDKADELAKIQKEYGAPLDVLLNPIPETAP